MRTIRVKIYKFSELSEKAKQKAIELLYDLNTDYDWWTDIYEDAENIGLKITGFNDGIYCDGDIVGAHFETAEKIMENHGKECSTYKLAEQYMKDRDEVLNDDESRDLDEIDNNFLYALLKEYRAMLRKDYEYRTSKEVIIESIESSEYEFFDDGKLIPAKYYKHVKGN